MEECNEIHIMGEDLEKKKSRSGRKVLSKSQWTDPSFSISMADWQIDRVAYSHKPLLHFTPHWFHSVERHKMATTPCVALQFIYQSDLPTTIHRVRLITDATDFVALQRPVVRHFRAWGGPTSIFFFCSLVRR